MTTSPKVPPAEIKTDPGIEPPTAREAEPEPSVLRASSEPDLEWRIKQRRVELIGKLGEIRSEASVEAVQTGDGLKARLSELAHILSVVDGWSNLGDTATHQLERWLAESGSSLSSHGLATQSGGS